MPAQAADTIKAELLPRRQAPAPPLPVDLQRELDAHRRRDPDFDPVMDASQISKRLHKWFERHGQLAA